MANDHTAAIAGVIDRPGQNYVAGTTPAGGANTIAAKANRLGFIVHAIADVWLRWDGTTASAAAGSIKVVAGATFILPFGYCPVGAISIFGAAANGYTFIEW